MIELNESNFESTVTAEGIVLVDVWAPWCGPCRAFAPTFEKAAERHPDVTFAKLNTEAQPGLGAALQIRAIPTLLLFRDGVLLLNQSGMVPGKALDSVIEQATALNMDEVRKRAEPKDAPAASA